MATVEQNELPGARFVWLCTRPIRVFQRLGLGKSMAFRHWGILVSKSHPDEMTTIMLQRTVETVLGPLWELIVDNDHTTMVSRTQFSTANLIDWSPFSIQLIGRTVKSRLAL